MKKLLTIFAGAALISFATSAVAAPNTFDVNGDLCVIGENNLTEQTIGTPMELWAGVGQADGVLAGYVTFEDQKVIINLNDADNDNIPDIFPWVATEVHIHFAATVDGIPHSPTGNPIPGQFEFDEWEVIYNIED